MNLFHSVGDNDIDDNDEEKGVDYKDTCESVNRAIMADLFSGSSSNLQRLQLLKVGKGGAVKRDHNL